MQSIAKNARIFVAGHRGLVGSAILRALQHEGYTQLLVTAKAELDLRDQASLFCDTQAGIRISGSRQSRRHPCQQHLSGGFSLR
jgi:nucleoside-diphosphate-sugar epimerase